MKVHLPASLVASGKFGRSNSLKWPWLYDKLVAKGYDHSKAAAISNSRLGTRKKGRLNVLKATQAHDPKVLKRIAADDKKGKHSTRKSLTAGVWASAYEFACHSAACAPPPAGVGGSRAGGSKVKVAAPVITAAEARGDSRPVSHDEFQRLAIIGRRQLDKFVSQSSPITGLEQNWSSVKKEAFDEVKKSWGGATFDAHTGRALPQGADAYAITVKHGHETVSVPENASRAEFDKAMETAKTQFRSILEQGSHHLGVFHDDENHRIDIDPVLVVKSRSEVDTIGAASRSIGGAYHFKDGNGYWPPHVVDKHLTRKQLTASIFLMPGTPAHEFACHSAACAPPPAGVGGSDQGGARKLVPGKNYSSLTRPGGKHERFVTVISQDGDNVTVHAVVKGVRSGAVISARPYVIPIARIGVSQDDMPLKIKGAKPDK